MDEKLQAVNFLFDSRRCIEELNKLSNECVENTISWYNPFLNPISDYKIGESICI